MGAADDTINKEQNTVAIAFKGGPGAGAPDAPPAPDSADPSGTPAEVHGIDFVLRLLDFAEIKAQLATLPFPKSERSINFFVFMLQSNPDCANLNNKAIATVLYAADNDMLNRNDFSKLVRRVVGTGDNLLEGVQQLVDAPHILGSRRRKPFSLYAKGFLPQENEPTAAPAESPAQPEAEMEVEPGPRVELWSNEHVKAQSSNRESRDSAMLKTYMGSNRKYVHVPAREQIAALLALKESMPNFTDVVDFIHEQLVAGALTPDGYFTLPPLLLGGEPGIGKTLFSQKVSEILGFPEVLVIPCGLENASFALGGSSSTWSGAKPGIPATMVRDAKFANTMILLDEIDKSKSNATSNGGDPFAALYQLLEPKNARRFVDQYLLFPINMSLVNWILTANDVTILPEPILDRVKFIPVPSPQRDQMAEKVIPSVYAAVLAERNLAGVFDSELPCETIDVLLECKTPRDVRHILIDAIGKTAVRCLDDEHKAVLPCDIVTAKRTEGRARIGF